MRVVRLEGVSDPRFADRDRYRVIGDHRELRAQGLFVAEGRLVVERVIENTGSKLDAAGLAFYRRLAANPGHVAAAPYRAG